MTTTMTTVLALIVAIPLQGDGSNIGEDIENRNDSDDVDGDNDTEEGDSDDRGVDGLDSDVNDDDIILSRIILQISNI